MAATSHLIPLLTLNPTPKIPFPHSQSPIFRSQFHFSNNRHFTIRNAKLSSSREDEESEEDLSEAFFNLGGEAIVEDLYDTDDENDETESSMDLLFRFLHSMFKKVSKRARKASRSVLLDVISPQLVSFAVDGVLLLASLSVMKALLEVVCTLGGTVFVAILLLRLIWAAIAYFQANGNDFNQSGSSYSRTQPVT